MEFSRRFLPFFSARHFELRRTSQGPEMIGENDPRVKSCTESSGSGFDDRRRRHGLKINLYNVGVTSI